MSAGVISCFPRGARHLFSASRNPPITTHHPPSKGFRWEAIFFRPVPEGCAAGWLCKRPQGYAARWLREMQFAWGLCRSAVPQAGSMRGNFPGAPTAGLCRRLAPREAILLGPVPQGGAAGWLRETQFSWGPCRRAVPQAGSLRGNFPGARAAGLCRRLAP